MCGKIRAGVGMAAVCLTAGALAQPAQSEWHFNGNLMEVGGPSRLRFLDDPDFGNPPNGQPTGQTAQLGRFGTTLSQEIPPIQGQVATVFRVPPPRTPTGLPSNSIGFVLWPSNRSEHPDGRVDQWSIIMDVLIPPSSFGPGVIIPLVNFDDNNGDPADLFILGPIVGGPPIARIGPRDAAIPAPQIQPNVWLRVSLVVDNVPSPAGGITTRMFVNGDFIGQAQFAGTLFNNVIAEDPMFADGSPVPPALWNRWGQFPSPWATSANQAPMLSTCTLFADALGEGRLFYIANLFFTDINLDDAVPISLDDPDPCRIVLCDVPCPADLNGDCAGDVFDLLLFLDDWFMLNPGADWDGDMDVDVFDLLGYLDDWFQPC